MTEPEACNSTGAARIRPATVADAERVAELHVRAWRGAYAGIVDERNLAAMSVAERTGVWRRAVEQSPGSVPGTLWVAERDGALEGFAFAGPERDPDPPGPAGGGPGNGELVAIYVDPAAWGLGVGKRLFGHACAELRAAGHRAMILWVLAGNERAQRFYAGRGMCREGAAGQYEPRGPVAQTLACLRYRLDLD